MIIKLIRLILYIAFGVTALLLWNKWQHDYGAIKNQQVVTQSQTTTTSSGTPTTGSTATQQTASPILPSSVAKHVNEAVSNAKHPSASAQTITTTKNFITVTTNVLKLKINPVGGTIAEAQLLKYPLDQKNPNIPISLLNSKAESLYIAQSGITNVPSLGNNPIPFTSKQSSYQITNGQKQVNVNLTWQSASGLKVTKTFTLNSDSYDIKVNYHVANQSGKAWQGRYYMQTKRRNYAGAKKDHLIGFHTFFGIALSTPSNTYQKYTFDNLSKTPLDTTAKNGWLAVVQHYFISAWVPDPKQSFYYYSQDLGNKTYVMGMIGPTTKVAAGQQTDFSSQFYVGPEIATYLKPVAPHLKQTIDYGWLWPIGILIFWLLKHVYEIVRNWGWAIIIVTILIKLAFYKFSEISYKSMAKMRAMQPKMETLKQRYAGDKQQMHKATMELYRKEGINPLGGCLPILIQIPVFIALYWVLIASVELRQAPWILWIHDLSAPDPYYILPIIMGLTMFLQQRLSPAPSDPMQAKMMMFLPVVFTVLFLRFPSGLVLYWIMNNTVSILQQWYIMRRYKSGAYDKKKKNKKKLKKK